MFGIGKIDVVKIAQACRSTVATLQDEVVHLNKVLTTELERVDFFNEELIKHEANWTEVLENMRSAWKKMKREFAVTRKGMLSLHKRVGNVERLHGLLTQDENFDNDFINKGEKAEEFSNKELLERFNQMEHDLNQMTLRVNTRNKTNPKRPEKEHPNWVAKKFTAMEEVSDNNSTRLNRIERIVNAMVGDSPYEESRRWQG